MTNLYFIRLKIPLQYGHFETWWQSELQCFTFEEIKCVVSEHLFSSELAAAQNHARELFAKGKVRVYEVSGFKVNENSLAFSPAEISDRWTAVIPTEDRPAR